MHAGKVRTLHASSHEPRDLFLFLHKLSLKNMCFFLWACCAENEFYITSERWCQRLLTVAQSPCMKNDTMWTFREMQTLQEQCCKWRNWRHFKNILSWFGCNNSKLVTIFEINLIPSILWLSSVAGTISWDVVSRQLPVASEIYSVLTLQTAW